MDETYQYTEAFTELQEIVAEIEQGEISVDELSEKVKRASILIAICKAKLTATEADVSAILSSLKQAGPEDEETAEKEPTEEEGTGEEGEAADDAPVASEGTAGEEAQEEE